MKFKLLTILLLGISSQVFSQAKPIYFDGNRITSNANKATSYGVYGKLSGEELWVLKRYDLYDNLMLSGVYKDDLLTTPHGKFVFYGSIFDYNDQNYASFKNPTTDRYISQQGEYVNGLEEGRWYDYFPDGTVMGYRTYMKGKMHGEIRLFSYKGRLLLSGQFKEGLKDGIWYDLKKKTKEVFENDKLITTSRLTKAEILAIE